MMAVSENAVTPQTNKFSWENDDKSSDLDRFGVTLFSDNPRSLIVLFFKIRFLFLPLPTVRQDIGGLCTPRIFVEQRQASLDRCYGEGKYQVSRPLDDLMTLN